MELINQFVMDSHFQRKGQNLTQWEFNVTVEIKLMSQTYFSQKPLHQKCHYLSKIVKIMTLGPILRVPKGFQSLTYHINI